MRIILIILGFGILGLGFISGCGEGIPDDVIHSVDQPNYGSIDGYVYDYATANYNTGTYTGTSGATVMTSTKSAITDANGYYKLEGIPAGEIAVTVFKDNYYSTTLIANRSRMNFLISPQVVVFPLRKGTATITGTIEGLPVGATIYGRAVSSRKSSEWPDWSYNASTKTYTISNAPDEGEVYVTVYYNISGGTLYYTYGKVTANPGETKSLDLRFGTYTSLSGNVSVPSGYTVSRTISCSLYKGYQHRGYFTQISLLSTATTYEVLGLPPLSAGDYYLIYLTAQDSNGNQISKYFYNSTGGTQDLDLSSVPALNLTSPSPANNANLSGSLPAFAWNPVSGSNINYILAITETSPESKSIWGAFISGTSISFPSGITGSGTLVSGKTYAYTVLAISYSGAFNWADYPDLIMNPPSDLYGVFELRSAPRSFTF